MAKLNKLARDKRLKRIMKFYGKDHQLEKTKEELNELVEAIEWYQETKRSEKQFAPIREAHRHMQEETADVYVMLAQIVDSYDFKDVDDFIDFKLNRQIKRMEEER